MDNLVVDSKLLAIIVDDEDADAAPAVVEGLGETRKETRLVDDGKTLLDIAALGHGDDTAILADIENTVLLEDRTKHVLDDDGWGRVGDEGRLLMKLLGEQVNTEVTVLTSLGGGGDADDLAGAALEDQEIADADVVAGDGDGVGGSHLGRRWTDDGLGRGRSNGRPGRDGVVSVEVGFGVSADGSGRGGFRMRFGGEVASVLFLDDYLLTVVTVSRAGVGVVVGVVVAVVVEGVDDAVGDAIGCFGDALTEGVVLAFFVVISHITLELFRGVDGGSSRFYPNLLSLRIARVN